MRAGLYVAEGAREVLRGASVFHGSPSRGVGLDAEGLAALAALSPTTCVILDAVVNTGASLGLCSPIWPSEGSGPSCCPS